MLSKKKQQIDYLITYSVLALIEKLAFFNKQLQGFVISLTNSSRRFKETLPITNGWSDFHEMNIPVLKFSFIKWRAKKT